MGHTYNLGSHLVRPGQLADIHHSFQGAVIAAISFFFFSSRRRHTRSVSAFLLNRSSDLTVPRLTLMSLIKMMLVMVSVAAISKTFGLLRFLLRLSFLAK